MVCNTASVPFKASCDDSNSFDRLATSDPQSPSIPSINDTNCPRREGKKRKKILWINHEQTFERCCDNNPEGSPSSLLAHLFIFADPVAGPALVRPLGSGATLGARSPKTISFLSEGGGIDSTASS
ncbi:Uncharacterized protein Rs2_41030 [Raphanus sativus]|nr:Uncharacterized protein Rs2_41030 [Raphanus sativus]